MAKILITDDPRARDYSQQFYPRVIVSRQEIASLDAESIADVWLDGRDTDTLLLFSKATVLRYCDAAPIDYASGLEAVRAACRAMVDFVPPEEPAQPMETIEDQFITQTDEPVAKREAGEIDEIPMREQNEKINQLFDGKRMAAGTMGELTEMLVDLCYNERLFRRDKITGLIQSCFAKRQLIPEAQAQTMFETHFIDRLAIKKTNYSTDKETGAMVKKDTYKSLSRADCDLLWRNVKIHSVFNSRKIFYDSIPQWDGEERIKTFMKKYYECDANPNFFLLLMTSIIGKIVSPENNYCPYFFDIVCNSKGIGKSLLCRRLLNFKYCGFLPMTSRRDDFYVNAYDGNNIIVVDDECTWIGKGYDKISYDEFKSLVTNPVDKFSRKFQQPEEHERCFIIMRTSNSVNTVFSTNERRQIVFECKLKENECRILDLPDEFFRQMLAEAKVYYQKYGVYKLTEADWKNVRDTNLDNYNWETEENFAILDYVKAVRSEPDKWGVKPLAAKFSNERWGCFKKYCDWCDANKKKKVISRAFWRSIAALSELPEHFMTVISDTKYQLTDGGRSRIFRVDPVAVIKPDAEKEIEDLPF